MTHNSIDDIDQPENEPSLTHPSYEALIKQLNDAETKANANWDMVLRTQAEFENYKRRAERDIDHAHKYANERYIRELLDIFDSIDHSVVAAHAEQVDLVSIQKGLELTEKMLQSTLKKLNLTCIDPLGESFNPSLHEAMNTQASTEHAPNTVIRVLQKGYQLHDRIIRPARVTVAKMTDTP